MITTEQWLKEFVQIIPRYTPSENWDEIQGRLTRILRKLERQRELYESTLSILRKYQDRENEWLRRIQQMAAGAYLAYIDQLVCMIPSNVYIVHQISTHTVVRAFFSEKSARQWCDENPSYQWVEFQVDILKIPLDVGDHFQVLKDGVKEGM
jgi:hypothetical protein